MRIRSALLALAVTVSTPAIARADATAFLGRLAAGDDRSFTRGFAVGASLLVVGFEFEYANSSEDPRSGTPSLRTTAGNLVIQTFGLPGFQLYLTTGAGIYRERLGTDEESDILLNNGGGIKINIAGPVRARVDYRVLSLKGDPRHDTVQRIYAGLNLAF